MTTNWRSDSPAAPTAPIGLTRSRLRAAAASLNLERSGLLADVLPTADQNGTTLTIYRRLRGHERRPDHIHDVVAIHRIMIPHDGVEMYDVIEGLRSSPRRDEQMEIDAMLARMMGNIR